MEDLIERRDALIFSLYTEGLSDHEISARLGDLGMPVGVSGISKRRTLMGLHRERNTRLQIHDLPPLEAAIPDYRALDDRFCAALRKHHSDKETGPQRTTPTSTVPMRALPNPVFSSAGLMVLG